MRRILFVLAIIVLPLAMVLAYSLNALPGKAIHGNSGHQESDRPKETGQAAFAAIAEIVELLANDPETDWSKVNITRLRDHLVDMQLLTTRATAVQLTEDNQVTFRITGEGSTLQAIRSMVPAHAREISRMGAWSASTREIEGGVSMTLSADTTEELTKIAALGFFGVLATGSHHQPHHLAIAAGDPMH